MTTGLPIAMAALFSGPSPGGGAAPSNTAVAEIPPGLLGVYMTAAANCPGLPWQVLASIGWIESRHAGGSVDPMTGAISPPILGPALDGSNGTARIADVAQPDGWAHAEGPMQFLSTTWAQWAVVAPDRPPGAPPDVQNAWDAIFTAARYLCAGQPRLEDLHSAVLRYNHDEDYWRQVLDKAVAYGLGADAPDAARTVPGSAESVIAAALTQLGVPYVWGGASPEAGFDCSGLVQWAYAQIGVSVPRTTFEQLTVGVAVALDELRPGDLIFSRGVENGQRVDAGHVALYAGGGRVLVAPRTGDVVSLRPLDPTAVQAIRRIVT
jgi:cell wall-associated NlpC family hydrolase